MKQSFLVWFRRCTTAIVLMTLLGVSSLNAAEKVLIPKGATWKYLDDGSDQGPVSIHSVDFFGFFEFFPIEEFLELSVGDFLVSSGLMEFIKSDLGSVLDPKAILDPLKAQRLDFIKDILVFFPGYQQLEGAGLFEVLGELSLGQLMERAGVSDEEAIAALRDSGVFAALSGVSVREPIEGSPLEEALESIKLGTVFALIPNWRQKSFDDGDWKSGLAEFGYGDGDEATVVNKTGSAGSGAITTTYFRHQFALTSLADIASLKLHLLCDDGAVVYLNGVEVARKNMPKGAVNYRTPAFSEASGDAEKTFTVLRLPWELLEVGNNVLAVEVHVVSNADMSFNAALVASDIPGLRRGPWLQIGTPTSLIIKWQTDVATDAVVRYGTNPANLDGVITVAALSKDHEIELKGLEADTVYYYSFGTTKNVLGEGVEFTFKTAVPAGVVKKTRFWALGDSGTGDQNQKNVRDAFYQFTGERTPDFFLLLGDNAYDSGFDEEYQKGFFDIYPTMLQKSVVWPTLGNHETGQTETPSPTIPYYQIFTNPTQGQAGGLQSGTEDYYSFDYGNIHVVSLDSMTSLRTAGSPMLVWLENDLKQNKLDWIVVIFHHPPYTKGSHDSDNATADKPLIEMRENALPILEAYGVDLILGGHSHCYERSFLIDGHYGPSSSLTEAMKKDGKSGRVAETGAYKKGGAPGTANDGAVYVVTGSAGKVSPLQPQPHRAMFISMSKLGSFVVDVEGKRMDARFLNTAGAVEDHFTIVKNTDANLPPQATITSPKVGTSFFDGDRTTVKVSASDSDGLVREVALLNGETILGVDTEAPYEFDLAALEEGTYQLVAQAKDELETIGSSAIVPLEVKPRLTVKPYDKKTSKWEMSFRAKANARYIVEFASKIDSKTWSRLTEVEPQPSDTQVLILYVVKSPTSFFRLRRLPN